MSKPEDIRDLMKQEGVKRLWMAGGPGSGKSHLCNVFAQYTGAMTLQVGMLLRAEYGEDFFIKNKESAAVPEELDTKVMELVAKNIKGAEIAESQLIIDSLKHSRLVEMVPGEGDVVVMVETNMAVMRKRLQNAPMKRKQLWAKAHNEWTLHKAPLVQELAIRKIPIFFYDNVEDVT